MSRSVRYLAISATAALVAIAAFALLRDEPAAAMDAPQFTDVSATAGVDQVYDGEFPFFVGGGIAAFDCDSDGYPDLFVAGGANEAGLFRNVSTRGGPIRFTAIADPVTQLERVVGAYPIDIDSDAITDLVVLRHGDDVLLRGLGGCRFEPANEQWGFDGGSAWTTGFTATWEDGSAMPTLAFGNYLRLDQEGNRLGGCWDNALVRPSEVGYGQPVALTPGHCSLSVLFSDWGRTGQVDLRISNDQQYYRDGEEQLWKMTPGAAPTLYSREEGWDQLRIFGMGIASHDVTEDGVPEVFLTSMGDNKLQVLDGSPTTPRFEDIALDRGVTAHRPFVGDQVKPSTAWHAEFEDVNNDSYVDLYISKGNVDAMVEAAYEDPNNLLMGQPDGNFVEGAELAGLMNVARSRGAAVVDLNLDGLLDIVEVNRREGVTVWQNSGNGPLDRPAALGNWVQLRLHQEAVNRDAVGSWIEIRIGERTLTREATIGGGHAGGQLGWIHFGLGSASEAEVRITWPDGTTGPWLRLAANTFSTVERGAAAALPWSG